MVKAPSASGTCARSLAFASSSIWRSPRASANEPRGALGSSTFLHLNSHPRVYGRIPLPRNLMLLYRTIPERLGFSERNWDTERSAMESSENQFPIGQKISLPGHFPEPVMLEAVRPIGAGYECRVRLPDGTPDEAILSREEAAALFGQRVATATKIRPADAEKVRLLVELARIRLAYAHDRHFA